MIKMIEDSLIDFWILKNDSPKYIDEIIVRSKKAKNNFVSIYINPNNYNSLS